MPEKYLILTDSCSDLPPDLIAEMGIEVIPMEFEIDGKTYLNYPDGHDFKTADFYDQMRQKHAAKTSQVAPATFIEKFRELLKINNNILVINFSSALSGTYNSGVTAAAAVKEEYPDANIRVVDSLSASFGEGLLVYYAAQKRAEGLSLSENADWLEQNRLHVAHWFTVDDLGTLKRGGRLSATKAFLGTALGLKPVLHVDDLGRLVPVSTTRGRKKALAMMIEQFGATAVEPEKQEIFISHGDDYETARQLGEALLEKYHVKSVRYSEIGPVIGAHSGPNTIALFFYALSR